jgi:hypothetical protein
VSGKSAFEGRSVGRRSVRREHELDRQLDQRTQRLEDLLRRDSLVRPVGGKESSATATTVRSVLDILAWAGLVMTLVVLLAVVRFAWSFFRGDVQLDDPGGSMGDQIFSRRKAKRPEDWLKN